MAVDLEARQQLRPVFGDNHLMGPMEQGLLAGREYADRTGGDHAKLRPVVRSRNAEETRAAVDWNLMGPIDEKQPVAFWSGFAHGVREFLVDEAATLPEQLGNS